MKQWLERLKLSIGAWIQGRKNKKQIDRINGLHKEILEHDLKFLENPFVAKIKDNNNQKGFK
tara:strand:+ start:2116 stop:2301 length:186 start_codon:yes stop_codon:yes gene_type:complete